LLHSCGWLESLEPMSPADAIAYDEPTRLAADPWVVTPEWLEWLRRPY
jgi:hypothetical protein